MNVIADPREHELKPCPFCGSSRLMLSIFTSTFVSCLGCGATGPEIQRTKNYGADYAKRLAASRWNARQ